MRFYAELAEAGERLDVFGASIVVASLEMIIESKEGANRDVDQEALPHLRALQADQADGMDFGL